MVQYEHRTNSRSKQRPRQEKRILGLRETSMTREKISHGIENEAKKEKNGKCCTHSDIKLILFIMHQSNSAKLARAYIMQKQVLPFRCCFDMYSDYAVFTILCRFNRELVKKLNNDDGDASYFRVSVCLTNDTCMRPTPFMRLSLRYVRRRALILFNKRTSSGT